MAALSQQFPFLDILTCIPYRCKYARYASEVYWHPLSLWCNNPAWGRRRANAWESACSASFSSQFLDIDQPTTIREYRSRITATYNHPCTVGIEVMSVTHFLFGASAVKSRFKRFGATGWVSSLFVVLTRRRLALADSSSSRISLATRFREQLIPSSCKSL